MNNELTKLISLSTEQNYILDNIKNFNYYGNYSKYLNGNYTNNFIYKEFTKNDNIYSFQMKLDCDLFIITKLVITTNTNFPDNLINKIGELRITFSSENNKFFDEELKFLIKLCGYTTIDNKIIINMPFDFLFKKFYQIPQNAFANNNLTITGNTENIVKIENIINYNCINSHYRNFLINDLSNVVTDICQTFESDYFYLLANKTKIKLPFNGISRGLFIETDYKIKQVDLYLNDFVVHSYNKLDFELNNFCDYYSSNGLLYISFDGNIDIKKLGIVNTSISFCRFEKIELCIDFEDNIDFLNSKCKVIVHNYITMVFKVSNLGGYYHMFTKYKNYSNKPIVKNINIIEKEELKLEDNYDIKKIIV